MSAPIHQIMPVGSAVPPPCPPVDAAGYRRGRRRPQDGQRDPDRDRGQPTYRRGSFVAHVRGGTGLTTAPPMPAT